MASHRGGLVTIAAVKGRLAAAGLVGRHDDLEAKPLEHGHGGIAHLRAEPVDQARHEQLTASVRVAHQNTYRARRY